MKLAIISDTHDNLATLDKFLAYVKQNPTQAIVHCGDIASGETLKHLAEGFDRHIWAVLGNMDYEESVQNEAKALADKVTLFKSFGHAVFDDLKIGFCHSPEAAKSRCQNQEFDYVFYGHTHKPWVEKINGCTLANPGTLAGMFYQATFAVLDTETRKLELKIVERI
jgi:putative phosphoesterase